MRAFAHIPADLIVVGDGPEKRALESLAPRGVRLVGHAGRDELARWYAAADAFVLPSRSEAWGMALSEAAAAGLPLVVTHAVGAAHDLVEHGTNGLVVATGDESALREA